jgi:hypothetical protein
VRWINGQHIATLNIAGPRESKYTAGIYVDSLGYLEKVFNLLKEAEWLQYSFKEDWIPCRIV